MGDVVCNSFGVRLIVETFLGFSCFDFDSSSRNCYTKYLDLPNVKVNILDGGQSDSVGVSLSH